MGWHLERVHRTTAPGVTMTTNVVGFVDHTRGTGVALANRSGLHGARYLPVR